MRTIFLGESNDVNNVYSDVIMNELAKYECDRKTYSKNYVVENPELFDDTEYIFSTWEIPLFSEEEINTYFPNLKCVFYAAGTVREFASPFINCGVKVFSAWAANAVPVAEYTVAQIILANKGFHSISRIFKNGEYRKAREEVANYCGNYGAEIGIIGAGMIGKHVIRMLKNYNLKVKVFDVFLSDTDASQLGVEKVSLGELFSSCKVVSNHLADNKETRNMLNYKLFDLMPPYATFINTGRGVQVVESDLIKFLVERPDVTAILDVTNPEPPLENSRLFKLDNCILTPHIAGSSGDELHRLGEYMFKEFENYRNNKICKYEVTAEMLKTMA